MNQDLVLSLALPITLFCIMFGMGFKLSLKDFGLLLHQPVAVLSGITSQMLILPAVTFLLLYPLQLQAEVFAGFMILSLCPGGTTSNMFSYLAGGNLALSVTLTAVVSIITPFTIPLTATWVLASQQQTAAIQLPFLVTMIKLVTVTLIPVALGMLLRHLKPSRVRQYSAYFVRIPLLMLLLVITGIIHQNWENMPYFFRQTGLPAVTLAVVALLVAYLFARGLRQSVTIARTIAIETSIQNGGTAILITGSILHNPAMTIAPVMYGILMLIPVAIFVFSVQLQRPVTHS